MANMTMPKVTFSLHNALSAWQWSPFSISVAVALVAIGYWYLQADWKLAIRGRRWPARRSTAFISGLVAIEIALQSPVATFTANYFEAHVIQHLLLMVVAPPLLALGAPSTLLLQTSPRQIKVRWLAILRSRPFAILTHPISAWFLYFGVMYAFFLSSLINTAMEHMALMDVFNLLFLLGGTLYWWPVIGVDPIVHWRMGYGARMFNVLLGAAPEAFLGIAILGQTRPIASMYSLASTHVGGGMLWASTEFSSFAGFVPVFVQWLRSEERAAARADNRARKLGGQTVERGIDAYGNAHVEIAEQAGELGRRSELTTWEAAWLTKTGNVPNRRVLSRPGSTAGKSVRAQGHNQQSA